MIVKEFEKEIEYNKRKKLRKNLYETITKLLIKKSLNKRYFILKF